MEKQQQTRTALIDEVVNEMGWDRISDGVAAMPGSTIEKATPGSLVFDVDGVLIATHLSFREVIPAAAIFVAEQPHTLESRSRLGTDGAPALKVLPS